MIEKAKNEVNTRNLSILHLHAEKLRQLISVEELEAPVEIIISTGVFDTLKKMLDRDYWENQKLLSEVLWILINLVGTASLEIQRFIA